MSEPYAWLKLVHIVSAALLFGTGLGTAWFMWRADRTGDVGHIAATAKSVVLADWLFIAPAVVVQPLTGVLLIEAVGYGVNETWIVLSILLYLVIGACWLPVVWLQMRCRDAAAQARDAGAPLPERYRHCMRGWFALGWPAFAGVVAIFFLMIFKPGA